MGDTTRIGTITQGKVLAALVQSGRVVCIPFGEQPDYDLIVEFEGVFKKVQCKTGRLKGGAVHFNLYTMAQTEPGAKHSRRPYGSNVDFYGVYCPGNGKVYLVPQEILPENLGVLRVAPQKTARLKAFAGPEISKFAAILAFLKQCVYNLCYRKFLRE